MRRRPRHVDCLSLARWSSLWASPVYAMIVNVGGGTWNYGRSYNFPVSKHRARREIPLGHGGLRQSEFEKLRKCDVLGECRCGLRRLGQRCGILGDVLILGRIDARPAGSS